MAKLGRNRYGKSAVRIVKLERAANQHTLRDANVAIALEGDFETVHTLGDNTRVLPTDTMKNTVYALAREHYTGAPEAYAVTLAQHFLSVAPHASGADVRIAETQWNRIDGYSFIGAGSEQRLARAVVRRDRAVVYGGIDDMNIVKTKGSGFEDFLHDAFTTLPDTSDRIFATALRAVWRYGSLDVDHSRCFNTARETMLMAFAAHDSRSVQHTLYAMGEAALDACPEMDQVRLLMPNRHHLLIDLGRFGMDNRNDIFVKTSEPYGRIEAIVRRGEVD